VDAAKVKHSQTLKTLRLERVWGFLHLSIDRKDRVCEFLRCQGGGGIGGHRVRDGPSPSSDTHRDYEHHRF
jgi:hypothetical protein